jgi:hypothetical protein
MGIGFPVRWLHQINQVGGSNANEDVYQELESLIVRDRKQLVVSGMLLTGYGRGKEEFGN